MFSGCAGLCQAFALATKGTAVSVEGDGFFLLMFLYYFDDMVMFSLSFDSKKSEVLMLKDLFVGALSSQRLLVSNFDDMTVTSMT